jgi:hypothetical protein
MVVERGIGPPLLEIPVEAETCGFVHGHEAILAELVPRITKPSGVMSSYCSRMASDTCSPVHASKANSVL